MPENRTWIIAPNDLPDSALTGGKTGLEKESLRINYDGNIAVTPHPKSLGAPLTHSCITTDFSEALLELVTPPCARPAEAIDFLNNTEAFVHRRLDGEYLWAASMPCRLDGNSDIPIARYGDSELGKKKTRYREGLALRYGKTMQVIAGVHFNYSFSDTLWTALRKQPDSTPVSTDDINARYMGMIRNLQRFGWINLYLFGASPAVCRSFTEKRPVHLRAFDEQTWFHPHATSLRMSDIGYTNDRIHTRHQVIYHSLPAYIESLDKLTQTPHPKFALLDSSYSGTPRQLNGNILQIENELYATVRPKQIPQDDETYLDALRMRGIRYVELRSIDVNPFFPNGITAEQLAFVELLMHYCLLQPSPEISDSEALIIHQNYNDTAYRGRDPQLNLLRDGHPVRLHDWAMQIIDNMQAIADAMDKAHHTNEYSCALNIQRNCVAFSELTPSSRMLQVMENNNESFTEFVLRQSMQHHRHHLDQRLETEREKYYQALSRKSHRQQQIMEADDKLSALIERLKYQHDIDPLNQLRQDF